MLPANESALKKRFMDAYLKIMAVGERMPTSFYYEDTSKGPVLKQVHGDYEYSPYGTEKPKQ